MKRINKISKNQPCPCGSGKNYKRCCLPKNNTNLSVVEPKFNFNKHFNRYETAIDHIYFPFNHSGCNYTDAIAYNGKIKCRLVHEIGNSVIIPDFILLKNGWIQPLKFTAPIIIKIEENRILCDMFIDIQNGITLKVRFYNHQFSKAFPDKSQLFNCEIYGPDDIEDYICGEYKDIDDKIYLKLFHHTSEGGYTGITSSMSLRSSKWNYRGSKECKNFHFCYFTHIPEIKYNNDLITVAMSADGNIDYIIDSFIPPTIMPVDYRKKYETSIYTAKVYRSTTKDRNYPISFDVPIDCIDLKHIYKHNQNGLVFYEICFPYIHRLKLTSNSVLPFNDEFTIEDSLPIVKTDYSIIGDATTIKGLAAPFEEDSTKYIFKIQDCGDITIHEFWLSNGNKDLYSSLPIEGMEMNDVDNNPTN